MSNLNTTTVGLIRLPGLAAALADAGVRVATGEDFRSSAKAIVQAARAARDNGGTVVVLLADVAQSGELPWLEKTLRSARSVIVQVDLRAAADDPDNAQPIGGNTGEVPRVSVPADVATVLELAGVPCPPDLLEARINRDGSITRGDEQPASRGPAVSSVPSWPGAPAAAAPASDPGWDAQPAPTRRPPLTASQPAPSAPSRRAPDTPSHDDWESHLDRHVGHESEPNPYAVAATPAAPVAPAAPAVVEDHSPAAFPTVSVGPDSGAQVILVGAGKGGVSKSTTAMTIAQRAARLGHMRVVLIDGNRGQGDLRTFMRLSRASLPTVYDVATGADPAQVIITPDRLAANRPQGVDRLEFAMVMAPPNGLADPTLVTSDVYRRVLDKARSMADLVVVDTQIQESADTSGLFDDVWIPALATHAWFVGISDLSTPGVNNLHDRLREFVSLGVPTSRIGVMLNRVSRGLTFDENKTKGVFSRFGRWLGVVHNDDAINAQTNNGELPWDHPEMAYVLDQVLFQVTTDPVFSESRNAPAAPATPEPRSEGGLFGLFRRKGS